MAEDAIYARTAAVWLGAAATFGTVTAIAVGFGVLALLGNTPLGGTLALAVFLLPLLVAAKVTDEATRVYLHGWDELQRGSPRRRLLRHAILLLPVAVAGALALLVVLGAATSAPEGLTDPWGARVWIPGLVVAFALGVGWVAWRTADAFRAGRLSALSDEGPFRK